MTPDATRSSAATASGAASETATAIGAQAAGQAGAENFPVALRFLPRRHRESLAAIYGFARSVDDFGDEAPVSERLALLEELEADVRRLYAARVSDPPRLPVIRALAPMVSTCHVPRQPFDDLIAANRQDQTVTRYQEYGGLLKYCELSANPVGHLVLYAFGVMTPQRRDLSDKVCTALQLAEHWQDVAEDYRAGRIYLPGEDMERFGCQEQDLAAPTAPPRLRALMDFEVTRAAGLLGEGAPIVGTLRGAARAAVAGYVAGGRAALAAIRASSHDVLAATPRPAKGRLVRELARAYATGR